MNQIVPADQTSTREIGIATGPAGAAIAPQNLGEVVRFAEVMSRADIALPKHLRGNAGACMAVAMQALQWEMNPFAVASKSYSVNGIIAYEAQLIAAVVNTRSGIKGRLRYEFIGEGNDLSCKVTGILDGDECSYETPPFEAINPKNSPLWKTDPRQQLGYYAARSWARRHCPEVLLGIYDRDEAASIGPDNARDVTPSVMSRLQARQEGPRTREGFDQSFVARETAALTGGADSDQNEDNSQSSVPSPDDGSSGGDTPSSQTAAATNSPSDDESGTLEEGGNTGQVTTETAAPSSDPVKRLLCEELVDNMIRDAFSEPAIERPAKLDKLRDAFLLPENLGDEPDFIRLCHETARRIIGNPAERERAREFLTGKIPVAKGGA